MAGGTSPDATSPDATSFRCGGIGAMMTGGITTPGLRRAALLAVASLGVTAVTAQLVLMRELTAAFSGNELVFGISLGTWLLLTAAGAALGRFAERAIAGAEVEPAVPGGLAPPAQGAGPSAFADSAPNVKAQPPRAAVFFAIGLALIALLPLAEVAAVRGWRDVVFPRGAAVGGVGTTLGCLGALAPFCLGSGLLLTLGCGLLARGGEREPVGPIYSADAVGSVAGGVLFTFVLVRWCDPFTALGWAAGGTLVAAAWLAAAAGARGWTATIATGAVALAAVMGAGNLDARTTAWQHAGEIVWRSSSPHGRLVVTQRDGQLTFFVNGAPVGTSDDVGAREEAVHYAMAQRPDARAVLVIGGVISGAAREVLRYPAERVVGIELDPQMLAAARRLLPAAGADSRLTLVAADGRRFVQRTAERFDVIILDVPDSATLQLNRLFTAEFLAELKHVLAPDGVVAFGLGHYENFVSPRLAAELASAWRTLRSVFPQGRMIPGGRVFFLGSDGALTLNVAERLEQRGIELRLVKRSYLDAMLTPDRLADLERAAAQPAPVNRDFAPVLYALHLQHWLAQFRSVGGWPVAALLLAAAACFVAARPVSRVIFASGFAASGLEVVLLVALQVSYGAVYQRVGLVVALFMAGLAAGAMAARRWSPAVVPGRRVAQLGALVALLAAGTGLGLPQLRALDAWAQSSWPGQTLIFVLAGLMGAAVGAQFPPAGAAASGGPVRAAARLFGADLMGAALGALLVSAWLIPAWGVREVCFATAGLNALAAGLLWWRTARR